MTDKILVIPVAYNPYGESPVDFLRLMEIPECPDLVSVALFEDNRVREELYFDRQELTEELLKFLATEACKHLARVHPRNEVIRAGWFCPDCGRIGAEGDD